MNINSKNSINTLKACLIIVAGFLTFSCNSDVVYEDNERVPGNEWNRYFVPEFEVEISDTASLHNLYINLRNTGEYPRSNIFLFVSASAPGGAFNRDTLELNLAGPSGKWLGRGYGSIWQNRFLYRQNVRFPKKGVYHFSIEQAMRIEDLPGITDVGILIEKSN